MHFPFYFYGINTFFLFVIMMNRWKNLELLSPTFNYHQFSKLLFFFFFFFLLLFFLVKSTKQNKSQKIFFHFNSLPKISLSLSLSLSRVYDCQPTCKITIVRWFGHGSVNLFKTIRQRYRQKLQNPNQLGPPPHTHIHIHINIRNKTLLLQASFATQPHVVVTPLISFSPFFLFQTSSASHTFTLHCFFKKDRHRPRWNRTALAFAAGGDVGSTSGIQLHLSTSGIQLYLSTISSSSGDQRHLSSAVYHQCYNSSAAASDVHRQHNIKPSAPQPAGAAERWIADGGAGGADSWDRDRRVNCADWRGYFRNLL